MKVKYLETVEREVEIEIEFPFYFVTPAKFYAKAYENYYVYLYYKQICIEDFDFKDQDRIINEYKDRQEELKEKFEVRLAELLAMITK